MRHRFFKLYFKFKKMQGIPKQDRAGRSVSDIVESVIPHPHSGAGWPIVDRDRGGVTGYPVHTRSGRQHPRESFTAMNGARFSRNEAQ